jgi:hypothetical protein
MTLNEKHYIIKVANTEVKAYTDILKLRSNFSSLFFS